MGTLSTTNGLKNHHTTRWLQKRNIHVQRVISPEQREMLWQVFTGLDTGARGSLDANEILRVLRLSAGKHSQCRANVKQLTEGFQALRGQRVTFSQFADCVLDHLRPSTSTRPTESIAAIFSLPAIAQAVQTRQLVDAFVAPSMEFPSPPSTPPQDAISPLNRPLPESSSSHNFDWFPNLPVHDTPIQPAATSRRQRRAESYG
ncbi:hypothetical protein CYMTET_35997, partial [Cymbomonas tetramitiformis]